MREHVDECVKKWRYAESARKFYETVKRLTEGFKPVTSCCKDDNGYLVTDSQGMWEYGIELFFLMRLQNPISNEGMAIMLPFNGSKTTRLLAW